METHLFEDVIEDLACGLVIMQSWHSRHVLGAHVLVFSRPLFKHTCRKYSFLDFQRYTNVKVPVSLLQPLVTYM